MTIEEFTSCCINKAPGCGNVIDLLHTGKWQRVVLTRLDDAGNFVGINFAGGRLIGNFRTAMWRWPNLEKEVVI